MSDEFIEDPRSTTFPCLRMSQPIGDFFVGVIGYHALRDISFFDVRRKLQEERDVEKYLGIQRPLNESRVRDLQKYVSFYDATFPTSIIIAVDADTATYSEERREMTLSNVINGTREESILYRQIARVLDGQHRIAGLSEYNGESFDLDVTVFVGIDIAQQAQIFSTVNLEQTKVNKSLAYDLFALSSSRSPQKSCHNVVVALDQDPTSAFYHKIKRLGVATTDRIGETLTQASFVEALLRLISRDPRGDRDQLLRGRKLQLATGEELRVTPLRNLFVQNDDMAIAKIIWNYFEAIRLKWPTAWRSSDRGYILNKTNGFRALMRLFRPIYMTLGRPGDIIDFSRYGAFLQGVSMSDEDFHISNFLPGSSGEAALVQRLADELAITA